MWNTEHHSEIHTVQNEHCFYLDTIFFLIIFSFI